MIERHITFSVHPDMTAEFERFFSDEYRPPVLDMPGLIECSLLREAELLTESFCIMAPKKLAALVERPPPGPDEAEADLTD